MLRESDGRCLLRVRCRAGLCRHNLCQVIRIFIDLQSFQTIALMAAHQYHLDNLCAVIDRNHLQISGNTEDVMGHENLHDRFASFGWHVIDVSDGNDIDALQKAFIEAKNTKNQPTVIIANTIKGKGSPVMENKASWHHHVPSQEEYATIMADLKKREEAI